MKSSQGINLAPSIPSFIALMMTAMTLFLPVPFILLLPVPIAFSTFRYGKPSGIVATISCALFIGIAGMNPTDSLIVIVICLSGIIIGESLRSGAPFDAAILKAAVVPVAFLGGIAALYLIQTGQNPFTALDKWSTDATTVYLKDNAEAFRQFGVKDEDLKTLFPPMMKAILGLMPGVTVVLAALWTTACYAFTRRILFNRGLIDPAAISAYSLWQAPEHAVWGVIIPGFLYFVPELAAGVEHLRMVAGNMIMAVSVVYLFQGMAVLWNILGRVNFPSYLKVIIIIPFIFNLYGMLIICVSGLADTWADFRKIRVNTSTPS